MEQLIKRAKISIEKENDAKESEAKESETKEIMLARDAYMRYLAFPEAHSLGRVTRRIPCFQKKM